MLLQLYWAGRWHDAATLSFAGTGKDSAVYLDYLPDYLRNQAVQCHSLSEQALSVNAAVPALLTQHGCPEEILHFPAIGFAHLPDKLHRMKLR